MPHTLMIFTDILTCKARQMYTIIGVLIGVLINHIIINPIERNYWHQKCIDRGLAPKD